MPIYPVSDRPRNTSAGYDLFPVDQCNVAMQKFVATACNDHKVYVWEAPAFEDLQAKAQKVSFRMDIFPTELTADPVVTTIILMAP
ncbi:hypothetical protein BDN67DRAFT_1015684 [Paxillus ammoniavirescens]|nr:hypothetical protein BDN67DRAFT_1015684 [Paxillus ammoniavirescens]